MSAKIHPHLSFDGDCREAFALYAETLGAKAPFVMTYGESPMAKDTPAAHHGRVLHATLTVGTQTLTGADLLPDQYKKPQGSWVMLQLDTPAEADRVFAALAQGGQVTLAIQETFWTPRFGMVIDRFSTPWIVQVPG